jgi:hypothetical protein
MVFWGVELVGLPGAGKTVLVQSMKSRTKDSSYCLVDCGRHHGSWWRARPRHVVLMALSSYVSLLVIIATKAPLRMRALRVSKYQKRFKGLILRPSRNSKCLFDEGPLSWVLAERWRDEALARHAFLFVSRLYLRLGIEAVLLEVSPLVARKQRLARHIAQGRPLQEEGTKIKVPTRVSEIRMGQVKHFFNSEGPLPHLRSEMGKQ